MTTKWIIFWILFALFLAFEGYVLYNSWFEEHFHGYDGGYFLFFCLFGFVGAILFTIIVIINTLIARWERKKNADK